MSDEVCNHSWGESEMCETGMGNIHSPTCRYCGAVKVVEERRAYQAAHRVAPKILIVDDRPSYTAQQIHELGEILTKKPAPIGSNLPPPGSPPVHPFQSEFFTNL